MVESLPLEVVNLLKKVDELSKSINPDNLLETTNVETLDHETFISWLNRNSKSKPAIKFVSRILSGGLLSSNAGEISVLQMALYVATGNGTSILLGMSGGAQQDRIVGGPEYLEKCMAEDYGTESIYFNQVVEKIDYSEDFVEISTNLCRKFKSKKVILAIPPVISNRLTFNPKLPVLKSRMLKSIIPGSALKFHAIYKSPFWRKKGLSGITNSNFGFITESVDNSLPNSEKGIITFFAYGDEANILRAKDKDVRQEILLLDLAKLIGNEAKAPEKFIEFDWDNEPYSLGCFSGHFIPGALLNYSEHIRNMVGNIHWAGTGTATVWNGYFEGAVQAGEREAIKINSLLKGS